MKNLMVLCLLLSGSAIADELSMKTKKIIFDEIAMSVFFEDEGIVRAPSKISDFTFSVTDENLILVSGDSYSAWDDKIIHYDCMVKVLSRGAILSAKDIDVKCSMSGENWPND